MANDQRRQMRGKVFPYPGTPSSSSGGTLAGAARDLAAHRAVGLPRGQRRAAELGAGAGARVRGVAAAAIVPGGIRQRHCRMDAGSCRPGPAPVRGMARQTPAPCGRDKGCHCWPAAEGPSSQCGRGEHLARPWHGTGGRVVLFDQISHYKQPSTPTATRQV
jgi:hypothetical protein